ncbi:hypothetical protein IFM89_021867 [Coptis chinensis]|uniref:Myb/SANT-like domain-containing protein n=1 Tax=Coptis chinensis TaxID=261450 RepID=A0A835HGB7_9MAGN|nr:hypothetical protein IFM89_021867 [Coptis chinensis]
MENNQSPEQPKSTKAKGNYVVWTIEMDRVLTKTFLDQVQKGNKSGQGWKLVVWTVTVDAIKEKCGKAVTKDNVQARLKTWTKNFNIVTELRDQLGFGWDDNRKMMFGRTMLRYKPLTNYDELATIVGKNNAKRVGANTKGELDKAREEVENNGNNENDGHEDINGKNEGSDKQLKRGSDGKQSANKKVRTGDAIAAAVTSMTDTLKYKVETNSRAHLPTVDVNKLCQEVNKVPDFDRSLTLRVVDLLAADKTKEHVFYGLSDDLKKKWLMMHLNV